VIVGAEVVPLTEGNTEPLNGLAVRADRSLRAGQAL